MCLNRVYDQLYTEDLIIQILSVEVTKVIKAARTELAGELTQVVTPVPIPNTAVKHLGPMVVRPGRE